MKYSQCLAVVLAGLSSSAYAVQLGNGDLKIELAPQSPALLSYSLAGNTVQLPQLDQPVVRLNGKDYEMEVKLVRTSDTTAEYDLFIPAVHVTLTVRVEVGRSAVTLTLNNIRESDSFVIRTIEIPGLALLAGNGADEVALGNFPAPSYASEKPEDHDIFSSVTDLAFPDNAENKTKNVDAAGLRGASYAFVSNGKIAAGLFTNVLEENLRMVLKLDGEGDTRALSVAPGKWTYREIPTEILPAPQVTLVLATDRNGDGKVTWQDAALAYRENAPKPYGAELAKNFPIAHIAMNFGSQATNPFLRVLDNAKKVWLFTDGLGQRIQYKGYESEGHDSSHPDYGGNVGIRQGGRDELNFAMRRGHDFNIHSGVHINAHEYHKEAKTFSWDIADENAIGWSWLDESYLTDYRYDSAYGTLYQRLDEMRDDLPFLDFVYLDVYYGRGWPGWRMHTKMNSLSIVQFTEFPGVMERAVVWNHVANDWTQQIGGKGDRSKIARFIWYSQKDTFGHDPLLRGTNADGFMGWHAERDMPQTIKSAFTVNLPTTYLQNFDLLRKEDGKAWFTNGVRTEFDGKVAKIFGRDGQLINSCVYPGEHTRPEENLCFIPWQPGSEPKIYHWNDKGGDSTWDVPRSWAGESTAQLYRLTDLGRVFDREVSIADGKVTLTGIEANTPYVLYRHVADALPDMKWSEGGPVADTGFDSHSFLHWNLTTATETASIKNDPKYGQTELHMDTPAAAEVRQTVRDLVPGQTYSASAWVSITGKRDATFAVEAAPPTPAPFVDKQAWKVHTSVKNLGGDRPARMLDNDPKTLWHSVEAKDDTSHPHRVTLSFGSEKDLTGFTQTARADKGNGTIKDFIAEVSMDKKSWQKVAEGEFDYGDDASAVVTFAEPVKAKFFRLTAVSELNGKPFTSIAELDVQTTQPAEKDSPPMAAVSNTINRTVLTNFTDQSSKYMRPWHRLKVAFTAPADGRVDLALRAAAGDDATAVTWDDVRLVKLGVSNPPANTDKVVLFEDFENVDEGWGPFMYGWQGPMNTHFSEANPPYTDDTIQGKYSLKTRREGSPDMIYRTVPATLKLKPDTNYKVSFDYLSDTPECFQLVTGHDGEEANQIDQRDVIPDGSWTVKRFTATIKTGSNPDNFIGVSKIDKDKVGTLVIDNLLIQE